MAAASRKMHLVAYLRTGPTASYASAWRHPTASLHDIWDATRYEDVARLLEEARFDALFFADTLACPTSIRAGSPTMSPGVGR